MYLGSVKFFKHLILLTLGLVLLVPVGLATHYALINVQLNKELQALKLSNLANLVYVQQRETEPVWQHSFQATEEGVTDYNFDLEYQNLYEDLYVGEIPKQERASNAIYLTFDDGPSQLTLKILDVLLEKKVKATFFVVGKNLESENGEHILKRIVQEGHAVGIHTYSHIYSEIYGSIEDYLRDFYKTYDLIYRITDIKPDIYRFPGGSINSYNNTIYQELISEMFRRGFVYYDWNVSSRDVAGKVTQQQIYDYVVPSCFKNSRNIILFHDSAGKVNTLKALPAIIDELTAEGYQFETLSRNVAPITFGYRD